MWHLLCKATGRTRYQLDGISGSPPPQPIQQVSQARTDLQQVSNEDDKQLSTDISLAHLRIDMTTLSKTSQDPRLDQARELLSSPAPSVKDRRQAVELLTSVADDRLKSLQASYDKLKEHFVTIPEDKTPPPKPMDVKDTGLPR